MHVKSGMITTRTEHRFVPFVKRRQSALAGVRVPKPRYGIRRTISIVPKRSEQKAAADAVANFHARQRAGSRNLDVAAKEVRRVQRIRRFATATYVPDAAALAKRQARAAKKQAADRAAATTLGVLPPTDQV